MSARPEPKVSTERLDRQWEAIAARVPSRRPAAPASWSRPRTRAVITLGGLAAAAAIGLVAWSLEFGSLELDRGGSEVLGVGSVLETGAGVGVTRAQLAEGSWVELEASSRIDLRAGEDRDVELALTRGRARFDVVRDPERDFRVHVTTDDGEVVVRVVGTRFEVAHEGDDVRVAVERGVVEVTAHGEVARLEAGATWTSADDAASPAHVVPEAHVEAAEAPTDDGALREAPADAPSDHDDAPRTRSHAEVPDARTLFDQARDARQEGSVAEAARLYDTLLRVHDDDPRAGVAAFELGRLRMDALGDPRGALRAFDRALAEDGGAYREDAMARRVALLDRLGRARECRAARDGYLEHFPSGVHRASVAALCGEPTDEASEPTR